MKRSEAVEENTKKVVSAMTKIFIDLIKESERIPEWAIKKQNRVNFENSHLAMTFTNPNDMSEYLNKLGFLPIEWNDKVAKVCEIESMMRMMCSNVEIVGENFLRGIVKGLVFYIVNGQIIQVSVGMNANFEIGRNEIGEAGTEKK